MSSETNSVESVKVFIPNFTPQNDYSGVKKLGDMVIMTRGILVDSPDELHEKFRKYIATANDGDILMFSGSHLAVATAYAEWCERFPIARNIAIYNKARNDYTVHTVMA